MSPRCLRFLVVDGVDDVDDFLLLKNLLKKFTIFFPCYGVKLSLISCLIIFISLLLITLSLIFSSSLLGHVLLVDTHEKSTASRQALHLSSRIVPLLISALIQEALDE